MTQTVVDIAKLKDYDTARAFDALGTTLANIATAQSGGVNQIQLAGTATTVVPSISVGGTSVDTNIGIQLKGHGTGSVYIGGTGTTAASAAEFAAVTSAVNHPVVTPGATGNNPSIAAGGSGGDTNIGIDLKSKGTGVVSLMDSAGAKKVLANTTGVGFFATAPVAQQAITGALSTVADAPAKAVLTSIIAALVAFGLCTDGTT